MEDFQGEVHLMEGVEPLLNTDPSIASMPSVLALGLTHVPLKVATTETRMKRWNAGTEVKKPRNLHQPQHLTHPKLNPENLGDHLLRHSSCKSLFGPSHSCLHLALRAEAELKGQPNIAAQAVGIHKNSLHLLQNLKRRVYAEEVIQKTRAQIKEFEERYWLEEVFHKREGVREKTQGLRAKAHAAAVLAASTGEEGGGGSSSSSSTLSQYPPLPLSPSPNVASPRSPTLGGPPLSPMSGGGLGSSRLFPSSSSSSSSSSSTMSYGGKSFPTTRVGTRVVLGVTQRAPLSSLGSMHSLSSVQTFVAPESGPRRPPVKLPTLKEGFWSKINQDGLPPPQPLPFCPPNNTTILPPTSGGGGGMVHTDNDRLKAFLYPQSGQYPSGGEGGRGGSPLFF